MALDGPNEGDKTFSDQGITFVVNDQLYEKVKPINVDYVNSPMGSGFKISSNLTAGSGCDAGSCGSGCGC
jgi:Fe-S cluster assembly iron-binding protein IscA